MGYSHVVKEDEDFSNGIMEGEAEEFLRQDDQIAECVVLRLINDAARFSTGRKKIERRGPLKARQGNQKTTPKRGDTAFTPGQMRWVWAGGRKLKRLVRRREAEASLYQTNSS